MPITKSTFVLFLMIFNSLTFNKCFIIIIELWILQINTKRKCYLLTLFVLSQLYVKSYNLFIHFIYSTHMFLIHNFKNWCSDIQSLLNNIGPYFSTWSGDMLLLNQLSKYQKVYYSTRNQHKNFPTYSQ